MEGIGAHEPCLRLLAAAVAVPIVPSLICQETTSNSREPISPAPEEVAAHLIGEVPGVGINFSKVPAPQSIGLIPL
jgi:hypothetical protein